MRLAASVNFVVIGEAPAGNVSCSLRRHGGAKCFCDLAHSRVESRDTRQTIEPAVIPLPTSKGKRRPRCAVVCRMRKRIVSIVACLVIALTAAPVQAQEHA